MPIGDVTTYAGERRADPELTKRSAIPHHDRARAASPCSGSRGRSGAPLLAYLLQKRALCCQRSVKVVHPFGDLHELLPSALARCQLDRAVVGIVHSWRDRPTAQRSRRRGIPPLRGAGWSSRQPEPAPATSSTTPPWHQTQAAPEPTAPHRSTHRLRPRPPTAPAHQDRHSDLRS
jgi:hypothetical protein